MVGGNTSHVHAKIVKFIKYIGTKPSQNFKNLKFGLA